MPTSEQRTSQERHELMEAPHERRRARQARGNILENVHFQERGELALLLHTRCGYGATPSSYALEHYAKSWLETCRLWSCGDDDGGRG